MKMLKNWQGHWQRAMSARTARRKKNEGPWLTTPRNAWSATLFWPKAIRLRPSRSTASKRRWRKQSWNATLHGNADREKHAGHTAGGAGMRFVCDACQDITNTDNWEWRGAPEAHNGKENS